MKQVGFREVFSNPLYLIACGFGSGLVPKVPGTAGTLAAIPLVILLSLLSLPIQWIIVTLMFVIGCFICQSVSNSMSQSDPGVIVWDEIVGYCFAMVMVPVSLTTIVLGFFIFRLLDIFKPWPISWAERRFSGGFGIMVDDLLAGIFCNICLQILLFLSFL